MPRATRALASVFKPAMVTEYAAKQGADNEDTRWRAFRIFTNVVTLACGVGLVLVQDYPGNARGEHALTGLQTWMRRMYAGLLTGDFAPPPAVDAPPPPAQGGGGPAAQAQAQAPTGAPLR